jgi:predicted TIM-barrel fold metal-dependent hydrolase
MKNTHRFFTALVAIPSLMLLYPSCIQKGASKSGTDNKPPVYYTMEDFSSVKKCDTHVHFNTYDSTFLDQAKADNMQLLTINVNTDYYPPIQQQMEIGSRLARNHPQQIAFATTFNSKNWNDTDWQQKTLDYLKTSLQRGAVAVKIWKNIGMEVKDANGKLVMIDNPGFDPIFKFLQENKIPVVGHLGEPRNCWLPVEQMTVLGDKRYFSRHPEYHMYLHPEFPSYEDQIRARDRVLENHPQLQFIGAHLGSMEWSVDMLAEHLDKYPNLAVDMAARIPHFQYQAVKNWQKVRDFIIKYQDRLIYATDLQVDTSSTAAQRNKGAHERWLSNWEFFVTDHRMKIPDVESEFNGLHLPKEVIDKIFRHNAEKWFNGFKQIAKR